MCVCERDVWPTLVRGISVGSATPSSERSLFSSSVSIRVAAFLSDEDDEEDFLEADVW